MSEPKDPIVEHCRGIIQQGSRSLFRAASLLPRNLREAGYQLYAWCRHCDDLIDGQDLGHPVPMSVRTAEQRSEAERIADLRAETTRALRGEPCDDLVFQGLARIVRQRGIPDKHPFEFLDGLAMDVAGQRYRTLDELLDYCYHVAGVVGVMAGHLMLVDDSATINRLGDLGTTMQLTNIARDVIDDARVGRVYLPLDWLAAAGVAPEEVGAPGARPQVTAIVHRLLDHADLRYAAARGRFRNLPLRASWAIATARAICTDLGRLIRADGEAAWDRRTAVPEWRKYLLLGTSLATR